MLNQTTEKFESLDEPLRDLTIADLDREIFSKVDPNLLQMDVDHGEQTFREKIRQIDDYMSISSFLFNSQN